MRLEAFFDAVGPYLEGRASHDDAMRALWSEAPAIDARRLAIYGRFCALHRREALSVYPYTREVALRRGEEAWDAIVEGWFRDHPMHHPELNENGEGLAGWLAARGDGWLAELADFEWWEWRTRSAPDAAVDADPASGPLRLASTVELRPYRHDLVAWIDDAGRAGEPAPKETIVLFWRDADLDARRERATAAELRVLKAIVEGETALMRSHQETLDDLRAARIVLGAP